jgi:hypothetical protein
VVQGSLLPWVQGCSTLYVWCYIVALVQPGISANTFFYKIMDAVVTGGGVTTAWRQGCCGVLPSVNGASCWYTTRRVMQEV